MVSERFDDNDAFYAMHKGKIRKWKDQSRDREMWRRFIVEENARIGL